MQVLYKTFDPELPAMQNKRPDQDAGWDLFCLEDVTFAPGERKRLPVNLAIALPERRRVLICDNSYLDGAVHTEFASTQVLSYGLITGRSGMASDGWLVYPGIIDQSYRGQLQVVIENRSEAERTLRRGDRIAQLLFGMVIIPEFEQVSELPPSDRGADGFGSSGK